MGDEGQKPGPAGAAEPLTRIGRYEIVCELGEGGMGTVYLGRVVGPGGFERLMALKTLHAHLGRKTAVVRMFLTEARIAARIRHANVVPVFEVGEDGSRYFLAMEYVSGETLDLVIGATWRRQPFPLPLAAHLVSVAAEALHAAHELRDPTGALLGVIHRDVSPQNIIIGYDGVLRLTDFGVAKVNDQLGDTRPGSAKGKVPYMAPEQVMSGPLDRRVDVFALGIVLWETTVGRRLFKSKNDFITAANVQKTIVPQPSLLRKDFPPELEAIVLRALKKHPDERYSTAREFGDDLRRYLGSNGELITPVEVEHFMAALFLDRRKKRHEMERRAALLTRSGNIGPPSAEHSFGLISRDSSGGSISAKFEAIAPPVSNPGPGSTRVGLPASEEEGAPLEDDDEDDGSGKPRRSVPPSLPPAEPDPELAAMFKPSVMSVIEPPPPPLEPMLPTQEMPPSRPPAGDDLFRAMLEATSPDADRGSSGATMGPTHAVALFDSPPERSPARFIPPLLVMMLLAGAGLAAAGVLPGVPGWSAWFPATPAPAPKSVTPAAPEKVVVQFKITPETALIKVDGQAVTGDMVVEKSSSRRYKVEISAPKYRTETLEVTADHSQTLLMRLELQKGSRPGGSGGGGAPQPHGAVSPTPHEAAPAAVPRKKVKNDEDEIQMPGD